MTVYRGGTIQINVGAPSEFQALIDLLNQAVADAVAAKTAAQTSASNAETSYQDLIDIYLGAYDTAPTEDIDGTALDGGELYYNTTDNRLYVYDLADTTWNPLYGDLKSDGSVAMAGNLDLAGNEITNYAESDSSPISSSGTLTLDLTNGNIFNVALTENITTLTISNVPASGGVNIVLLLTQDTTGSRTITWPASVKWAGGTAPTLTTTASSVDILALVSTDAGTTWYGFVSGQDMQ